MKLSDEQFRNLTLTAPLVALDLVIVNPEGKVLLGLRNNEPAKDTWYFPGGRIRKGEYLQSAYERIAHDEVNLDNPPRPQYLGVVERMFTKMETATAGIPVHYIALTYSLLVDQSEGLKPDVQHSYLRWFTIDEVFDRPCVHPDVQEVIGRILRAEPVSTFPPPWII